MKLMAKANSFLGKWKCGTTCFLIFSSLAEKFPHLNYSVDVLKIDIVSMERRSPKK